MTPSLDRLHRHLARRSPMYLWLLVALAALGRHYVITLNLSDSLPGTLFLVQKGMKASRGELMAFRYGGGRPYPSGALFLKRLIGLPGSLVTTKDAGGGFRDYYVDGLPAGRAKPESKEGLPLAQGPEGVIPPGHYYLAAPHPDSLDSRYALVGWVGEAQIVGRALRIF